MNYFNSTIERKRGICLDCGIDAFVTAGRCDTHYPIHRKKMMLEKQKIKQKVLSLKNTKANISLAVINNKVENTDLILWFKMQMQSHEKYCMNCGKSLYHFSEKDWHDSIHHVLEKSIFKSVMTNPINCLILCRWNCHPQWHTSMLNASKMPCFEKAKEIVTLLYPLLTDHEKGRISEYYKLDTICKQG